MQDAIGIALFIQANRASFSDELFHHLLRFALRSIAPHDLLGPRLPSGLFYPLLEGCSQALLLNL